MFSKTTNQTSKPQDAFKNFLIIDKDVDLFYNVCVNMGSTIYFGMTQKQLAEVTGIYQADISKIERGLANPSVSTLKRLADGMGLKLKIEFGKQEG